MNRTDPAAALLWELYHLDQALLDLERKQLPGSLVDIMALVIGQTVDYAVSLSPYWTGALASSHRGEVENLPGQVIGYIYLDPDTRNPVTGDRPVDYGPIVHESQPWMDWTMEWLVDEILVDIEDPVIAALVRVAPTLGLNSRLTFIVQATLPKPVAVVFIAF